MSDIRSPKEALQLYFDDLLAGEELLSLPARDYADPTLEQQQRLEKLLQSTHAQIIAPPIAAVVAPLIAPADIRPAVIKPELVEIQEWEIETTSVVARSEPIVESGSPDELPINSGRTLESESTIAQSAASESDLTVEGLEWGANGLPQWAQKDFHVLLFQVSGLTLAVPLISLGQIQPLTDELTPLFGQADWFMGLLPTPAGKIRTVNTAKFVMPERYDEAFLKSAKYVISINGVPWGLAVDSVNQPITLRPEDVKWRSERSKRPWLAGTIKAHMCALLDVPMIGRMLMEADRNSPRPVRK